MNAKPSLFSELRRRNVFRVALTYAVVAWLLIEIASVLLPLVDAPESLIAVFVVLLALGFLVAVFISWAFEMTPEGLKRTQDLSPDDVIPYWSRRKFATFIFGVAGIAFCLSAYQLLRPMRAAKSSQSERVSTSQPLTLESLAKNQPPEQMLRILDEQWSQAAAARDLERTVAHYSEDAIVFPPNAASATTRETIRNVWKDLLARPGLVIIWKPRKIEIANSGDMAWVSGMYHVIMNDANGKPVDDRGKYLEVWKKQGDGNWKCGADIWNSDVPTPASTP